MKANEFDKKFDEGEGPFTSTSIRSWISIEKSPSVSSSDQAFESEEAK